MRERRFVFVTSVAVLCLRGCTAKEGERGERESRADGSRGDDKDKNRG